jgi:glutathione S-transferase
MYRVYGDLISGNCYKVQLVLEHLGIEYHWQHTDIMAGETRSGQFLARNPVGKIPLLETADGRYLSESNAIMCHLAEGSILIPIDAFNRAQMMQWLFWEQYSHEPFIATSRFIILFAGRPAAREQELQAKRTGGLAALERMDSHLAEQDYFTSQYSLADIALYAYTHVADEADFSLESYANIRRWIERVENEPGFVPMPSKT